MERLIGESNANRTPLNHLEIQVLVVLSLDCLIRITWEASLSQSQSSGCFPKYFTLTLGGGTLGSNRKDPLAIPKHSSYICKSTLVSGALLLDKLCSQERGTPRGRNPRHCRELMTKASVYPNVELAKLPIDQLEIDRKARDQGRS